MIVAVVALAVALAALSGTAVVLAIRAGNDRAIAAKLTARVQALVEEHAKTVRELGQEAAAHVDTRERLEKVIARLKQEIARLEEELDALLDPTLVRTRLRGSGLLGGLEEGTAAADRPTAAAHLPGAGSAGVGAGGRSDGRGG